MSILDQVKKEKDKMESTIKGAVNRFHNKCGEGISISIGIECEYIGHMDNSKRLTGVNVKSNIEL